MKNKAKSKKTIIKFNSIFFLLSFDVFIDRNVIFYIDNLF